MQLCDGSIVAFTVLHNVNCNHGLIYVTSQVKDDTLLLWINYHKLDIYLWLTFFLSTL